MFAFMTDHLGLDNLSWNSFLENSNSLHLNCHYFPVDPQTSHGTLQDIYPIYIGTAHFYLGDFSNELYLLLIKAPLIMGEDFSYIKICLHSGSEKLGLDFKSSEQ